MFLESFCEEAEKIAAQNIKLTKSERERAATNTALTGSLAAVATRWAPGNLEKRLLGALSPHSLRAIQAGGPVTRERLSELAKRYRVPIDVTQGTRGGFYMPEKHVIGINPKAGEQVVLHEIGHSRPFLGISPQKNIKLTKAVHKLQRGLAATSFVAPFLAGSGIEEAEKLAPYAAVLPHSLKVGGEARASLIAAKLARPGTKLSTLARMAVPFATYLTPAASMLGVTLGIGALSKALKRKYPKDFTSVPLKEAAEMDSGLLF